MSERRDDAMERLRLMAGGDPKWDLSENDCAAIKMLLGENERLTALLDTPETENFDKAVPLEAAHQVKRWGVSHDKGKEPQDWFWLIGYLAGKALRAHLDGNTEKAKHHCISTAAALRNWHAHIRSGETHMRPGIDSTTLERASQGAE